MAWVNLGSVTAYDNNGGGYYLSGTIQYDNAQDIANNRTLLRIVYGSGGPGGRYDFDSRGWDVSVSAAGGASGSGAASGSTAPNFSGGGPVGGTSGSFWINHTASGTAQVSASAYWAPTSSGGWFDAGFGRAYGGPWNLPTIPRATQPSVSPTSGDTGSSFTITHAPAVSTFYHDIAYSVNGGTSYTNIATNVPGTTTTTSWTPAHTLFPDATSGTAIIRVTTYQSSGGTNLGTKTVNLPLTVPSSVVPTISSVSWEDVQTSSPDIPALMGAGNYVQGWSKLKPTVTASGASGSTITSRTVTMAGQTTTSGTAFANPVSTSGSVPFSAVATDTRSRESAVFSGTVTVKAYNAPNLPTPSVVRTSDSAGLVPSPTGTYLRITPAASVSSLLFGTEKNQLEWRIRTRSVGSGTWTTVKDWTTDDVSSKVVWNTPYVTTNAYAANTAYEVEVSIRDIFNSYTGGQTVTRTVIVPTENVFMDWDGNDGIGIGKYRQNGMLDVAGDIYQGGYKVVDLSRLASTTQTGIVRLATDTETQAGTATDLAVTPAGAASLGGGVPAGSIIAWAASTTPDNWLECNGQAVSRTTYSDLFAIIGTQYGVGNGTTTFNVPDLRGRTIVGYDSTQTEFNALGKTGGAKTHVLTIAEMPSHNHTPAGGGYFSVYAGAGGNPHGQGGATLNTLTTVTSNAGSGAAHNNLQPYGTEKYIIKAIGGVGALSSTVESVLLDRVAKVEEASWELAVASSIASSGATATLDTATGIVTLPSGTTSFRLDGLFQAGYEYEFEFRLGVQSGHSTDNSVWTRMCENGVMNATTAYQTGGYWAQYNSTWGTYAVNAGSAAAIGAVSGAASYVDWVCRLHVMPGYETPKMMYMLSRSMTSGSARHTDAGHYTPSAATQYDGIMFFFNGAGTGMARGKVYVKKRRLLA